MSLIPKRGTVYVVDDDEAVRDSLQWLLEGKDYRVKCFDSSESFLSRFDPREVACLIADIRMDGMSGLELQDRLVIVDDIDRAALGNQAHGEGLTKAGSWGWAPRSRRGRNRRAA